MRETLVVRGELGALPHGANTSENVLRAKLLQICRDYPGLPDARSLTAQQIRFFYSALVPELTRKPNEG